MNHGGCLIEDSSRLQIMPPRVRNAPSRQSPLRLLEYSPPSVPPSQPIPPSWEVRECRLETTHREIRIDCSSRLSDFREQDTHRDPGTVATAPFTGIKYGNRSFRLIPGSASMPCEWTDSEMPRTCQLMGIPREVRRLSANLRLGTASYWLGECGEQAAHTHTLSSSKQGRRLHSTGIRNDVLRRRGQFSPGWRVGNIIGMHHENARPMAAAWELLQRVRRRGLAAAVWKGNPACQ